MAIIWIELIWNIQFHFQYEEKKKAEGKKSRDDKDKVQDILFALFEKHQYYNIKDLVRETNQPVTYLKSILNEVCNYNVKNPHKNMWELKPEYRHYKSNSDDEAKKKDDDGSSDDDWIEINITEGAKILLKCDPAMSLNYILFEGFGKRHKLCHNYKNEIQNEATMATKFVISLSSFPNVITYSQASCIEYIIKMSVPPYQRKRNPI